MGAWIADRLHERRGGKPGRALVMGLTFKENVPDLRNSRTADIVRRLRALGYEVDADRPDRRWRTRRSAITAARRSSSTARPYDLVVAAGAHDEYRALDDATSWPGWWPGAARSTDLKGIWRERGLTASIDRWAL